MTLVHSENSLSILSNLIKKLLLQTLPGAQVLSNSQEQMWLVESEEHNKTNEKDQKKGSQLINIHKFICH